MNVTMRKVSDVKPYDKNPRRNDGAVDVVAASIREFGFQQPLVVDKDGVLIVGHTRLKAAKKLGMKEVPVVVADGLTPEQVKAYRLADNKTGELAGWDFSLMEVELSELEELGFSMQEFGFAKSEPLNIDDFFAPDTGERKKQKPPIVCPHCGMEIPQ